MVARSSDDELLSDAEQPVSVPLGRERFLDRQRSEEHTSELQSLREISYAVFCLKKKIYIYALTK